MDHLMDEARELAENHILYDPCDHTIIDAVCEICNVKLAYNSMGARAILAQYNRYDVLNHVFAEAS
jgi:hypothetical protein